MRWYESFEAYVIATGGQAVLCAILAYHSAGVAFGW